MIILMIGSLELLVVYLFLFCLILMVVLWVFWIGVMFKNDLIMQLVEMQKLVDMRKKQKILIVVVLYMMKMVVVIMQKVIMRIIGVYEMIKLDMLRDCDLVYCMNCCRGDILVVGVYGLKLIVEIVDDEMLLFEILLLVGKMVIFVLVLEFLVLLKECFML